MHYSYKGVIKDILDAKDWTYAALARKLKVSRNSVGSALQENNARCGMTMENFLKYASALGARVYVEWEDDGDGRRRYRWEIKGGK